MQACWSLEPTRRPTFDQIGCFIQKELEVHKEQVRTAGEKDVLSPSTNTASGHVFCDIPLAGRSSVVLVGRAEASS